MGKDEVEKLVGSVYKGNWLKNVAASVIAVSLVLAVCIAVARLGDPFPYDGMAWFVPVYYLGRVLERPGLLILCMLLALTAGFAVAIIGTSADFKQISNLLYRQCDASAHMYALECMLAVRGDLKRMDKRRSLFNMAEDEYAMRLVKYGRLEEARDYLNTRWSQKRSAWTYRRTEHMLELAEAYRGGDTQRYDAAAAKLPWADRHDRYFPLWRMLMTREYEKTLKLLEGARAASPASGVLLSYIRARCFDGVGDLQRAEELYRAVAENGNTLPVAEKAREWLQERGLPAASAEHADQS